MEKQQTLAAGIIWAVSPVAFTWDAVGVESLIADPVDGGSVRVEMQFRRHFSEVDIEATPINNTAVGVALGLSVAVIPDPAEPGSFTFTVTDAGGVGTPQGFFFRIKDRAPTGGVFPVNVA